MRRILTIASALFLGSTTLSWAMPVQGEGLRGAVAFGVYCADCHGLRADGQGPRAPLLPHRPADLRKLGRRHGVPLPWGTLAPRVDPPPDVLERPADHACNELLREALSSQRFAWQVRRGTLLEVFLFLDAVQTQAWVAEVPSP